jgi:hypothetical protein
LKPLPSSNKYFPRRGLLLLFGICFCISLSLKTADAQQVLSAAFLHHDSIQDSVRTETDTIALSGRTIVMPLEKKSGSTAMLLSAILPGAGQVYAHRYYTIPLFWGAGAFFLSEWITCNRYYHDQQNAFSASVTADTVNHLGINSLKDQRDYWHDTRDKYTIYLALTYILNILDAYVGATMYSFDVSDNLGGTMAVRFRIPIQ